MMKYRLGNEYIDKGRKNHPDDQFLSWINIEGSGIQNVPGIRTLRFTTKMSEMGLPAAMILVTHEKTFGPLKPLG